MESSHEPVEERISKQNDSGTSQWLLHFPTLPGALIAPPCRRLLFSIRQTTRWDEQWLMYGKQALLNHIMMCQI